MNFYDKILTNPPLNPLLFQHRNPTISSWWPIQSAQIWLKFGQCQRPIWRNGRFVSHLSSFIGCPSRCDCRRFGHCLRFVGNSPSFRKSSKKKCKWRPPWASTKFTNATIGKWRMLNVLANDLNNFIFPQFSLNFVYIPNCFYLQISGQTENKWNLLAIFSPSQTIFIFFDQFFHSLLYNF